MPENRNSWEPKARPSVIFNYIAKHLVQDDKVFKPDINIVVAGKSMKLHKILLNQSTYICNKLLENRDSTEVVIPDDFGVTQEIMTKLLGYCRGHEISLTRENVDEMLKAATKLGFEQVIKICETFKTSPEGGAPSRKSEPGPGVIPVIKTALGGQEAGLDTLVGAKKDAVVWGNEYYDAVKLWKPQPRSSIIEHYLGYLWNQQRREMADIRILTGGVSFAAHKIVLACHSNYFQTYFKDMRGAIEMVIPTSLNISAHTFDAILQFVYTSELDITNENLNDVYNAAVRLKMPHLVKLIETKYSSIHPQLAKQAGIGFEEKTGGKPIPGPESLIGPSGMIGGAGVGPPFPPPDFTNKYAATYPDLSVPIAPAMPMMMPELANQMGPMNMLPYQQFPQIMPSIKQPSLPVNIFPQPIYNNMEFPQQFGAGTFSPMMMMGGAAGRGVGGPLCDLMPYRQKSLPALPPAPYCGGGAMMGYQSPGQGMGMGMVGQLYRSPVFLNMDVNSLLNMLNSDSVSFPNETEVFAAALQWLKHSPDRYIYVDKVMSCVRFTLMNQQDLISCTKMTLDWFRSNFNYRKILLSANWLLMNEQNGISKTFVTKENARNYSMIGGGGGGFMDSYGGPPAMSFDQGFMMPTGGGTCGGVCPKCQVPFPVLELGPTFCPSCKRPTVPMITA